MNVWAALFSVAAFVAVATPFVLRQGREAETEQGPEPASAERIRQIRWAMEELSVDAASGKISETDRDALKAELEEELAEVQNGRSSARDGGAFPRG